MDEIAKPVVMPKAEIVLKGKSILDTAEVALKEAREALQQMEPVCMAAAAHGVVRPTVAVLAYTDYQRIAGMIAAVECELYKAHARDLEHAMAGGLEPAGGYGIWPTITVQTRDGGGPR